MTKDDRSKRVQTTLPLHWRASFNGMIRNISLGGLYFNATNPPPIGEPLELQFNLPPENRALLIGGVVRWVSALSNSSSAPPVYGVGVEFGNLSSQELMALESFIQFSHQERRTLQRRMIKIPVEYRFSGNTFKAYATDISPQGIFLVSDQPLQLEDMVNLRFQLPGIHAILQVRGIVKWRHTEIPASLASIVQPGMGIEFTSLGAEERATIEEYLAAKDETVS